MRSEDIPELPGYLTVSAVAKMFGIQKESVFYKIYSQGAFKHVYRVGSLEETQRPVLLLLESEVKQVFKAERDSVRVHTSRELLNSWNKRVKDWGRVTQWNGAEIKINGRPQQELVAAYLAANPADPRPE